MTPRGRMVVTQVLLASGIVMVLGGAWLAASETNVVAGLVLLAVGLSDLVLAFVLARRP